MPAIRFRSVAYNLFVATSLVVSGANLLVTFSPAVRAQVQRELPAGFVQLQNANPGVAQTGNTNIAGTARAGNFVGPGAGLTGVNAQSLQGLTPLELGVLDRTNTWSQANNFTNASNSFAGNGQLLTSLNAGSLASGTVPDARLALGGDLLGPLSTAKVDGLQGRPVSATAPTSGQVLGFDGAAWAPRADSLTLPFSGTASTPVESFSVQNTNSSTNAIGIRGQSANGYGTVGVGGEVGVYGESDGLFGVMAVAQATADAALGAARFGSSLNVLLCTDTAAVITNGFYHCQYGGSQERVAVPIAYGVVSSTGAILSGTGNFTATRTTTGSYDILINGEAYQNSTFTVTITPVSTGARIATVSDAGSAARVNMFTIAGAKVDTQFQFTVWTAFPATPG